MNRFLITLITLSCVLIALSTSRATAQIAPELREDGVLYFEGNLPDKITSTLHTSVIVYLHRDFRMPLATFYPNQKIELIGMSPEGYLIQAYYRNNTVSGWIHPADLPSDIDPALFTKAKENQVHHDTVAVAIANKSVIQGMTPDEVTQSVGSPEQVISRTDLNGSSLTWIYTTYKEVPQYTYAVDRFGRAVLQTISVKIPIGQLTVDFSNGVVTSVTESKTDLQNQDIQTN